MKEVPANPDIANDVVPILRKLGRGMADVYLGFDPEVGRRVVLKLIERSRDDFSQMLMARADAPNPEIYQRLAAFLGITPPSPAKP